MDKKLLVIASSSIHTYNFINLVKDGFNEITLITDKANEQSPISTYQLDFSFGLHLFKTLSRLRTICNTFKPSIIHIHQANSYAFYTLLALKSLGIPIVLTAWGSDILVNPKKNILLKKLVQYILSHVDALTADSYYVLNSAQELIEKRLNSHNINFGIDPIECTLPKENMIYSNRLHKKLYNIDKILISFSKFHNNHSDWVLIIAGEGDETAYLEQLASWLGILNHVKFIGFVDRETNYSYYCRSKIYVSVPGSDSVSLSLVESIICDCIPFVSDLPANHELITDGLNGFLEQDLEDINFNRFEMIDQKILNTKKSDIKRLFSKDYNRQLYFNLYQKLLKPEPLTPYEGK
ncbi:glycosyltransferase [Sulfuricurvum sp.]|uniref:glycosyltransferase n=1 Tax=Sulfuricurvum sp. TaxID=2025608 RepID=UPI002D530C58|nr:glycosyltransferase [Sulfuricurvum sp.]HZF70596.1 glycosyltransferase [Sulfuricurvum sp.]